MSGFSFGIKAQKSVTVVEIGNDWLKIYEGQPSASGILLSKAVFRKLAQINEPIDQEIIKLAKQLKLNKKTVFTYLPRHLITVRILELPSTNLNEIDAMIQLQIGKQTPYSKEEIVYSYKVIQTVREGYTKIMLVIAKRNIVNERLEVLKKAGLEIKNVTVSCEAVEHWFVSNHFSKLGLGDQQSVILLDIDSNFSDFLVFHNKKLIFTKNILIGANHLEVKKDGILEKFIEEISHSLDVNNEEWKNIKPVKLIVSGASDFLREEISLLSTRLGMSCEMVNLLSNVRTRNKGAQVEETKFKNLSISSALGFFSNAWNPGYNLMSQEIRVQKTLEDKRKSLTGVGILIGAIILLASLLILIHIDNKNVHLSQIKQQSEKLKDVSKNVEKMRLLISAFQERLDAGGDPLNLLKDIYSVTPNEVYLTEISIQRKGSVSMKGRAVAMSEVFKYVNALENLSSLQSVQNTYATMNKENKDEYKTDFEITAVYSKETDNK